MPILPPFPVGDTLAVAGNFIFMLWFILVISALTGRRHRLVNAIAVWIILLIIRVFIGYYAYANPNTPYGIQIIPEPLSTYLFFAIGLLLVVAFIIRKNRPVTNAW